MHARGSSSCKAAARRQLHRRLNTPRARAAAAAQRAQALLHPRFDSSPQWCAAVRQPSRGLSWVLAGQVAASTLGHLVAAWLSAAHGRRASVWVGACICLGGIVLQGLAFSLAQLAAGYVCVGAGIGIMYQAGLTLAADVVAFVHHHGRIAIPADCADRACRCVPGAAACAQAVLLEDAEIAPTRWRGMFVSLWQLGDKAGHLIAEGVYLYPPITAMPIGWRLAFSAAAWPAAVILCTLPWLPGAAAGISVCVHERLLSALLAPPRG